MADGDIPANAAAKPKKSDLGTRLISALVMASIAWIALWLGGWVWVGFVVLLGGLVLWEWNNLVQLFSSGSLAQVLWQFFGAIYVSGACAAMVFVRNGPPDGSGTGYTELETLVGFILPIVAVDVGAYFAGRAIGGPKIAPSISPSKTWAGYFGGAVAASLVCVANEIFDLGPAAALPGYSLFSIVGAVAAGFLIAAIAQGGDFFESWLKRRAGVKDSSSLIPGHGGFFDRLDGFIAVFFVVFVVAIAPRIIG